MTFTFVLTYLLGLFALLAETVGLLGLAVLDEWRFADGVLGASARSRWDLTQGTDRACLATVGSRVVPEISDTGEAEARGLVAVSGAVQDGSVAEVVRQLMGVSTGIALARRVVFVGVAVGHCFVAGGVLQGVCAAAPGALAAVVVGFTVESG